MSNEGVPNRPGFVSQWFKKRGVSDEELALRDEANKRTIAENENVGEQQEIERQERVRPLAEELARAISSQVNANLDKGAAISGTDAYDAELDLLGKIKEVIDSDPKYKEVRNSDVKEFLQFSTQIDGNSGRHFIASMKVLESEG